MALFSLAHKNWTLEDWKNIIWTDETSVVLEHRREAVCKKSSDFIFWGCFTYKKKGPCHIWKSETAAAKHQAQKKLDILNINCKIKAREEWELKVLLAKLFSFIKKCLESQPNTVVLEDGALAYTYFYQQELYNIHKINHLLWPGNSPDLNMIEPAWMWLK
ncbi:hypothetical protein CISG_09667 [Coccidioides immitis RMSCC 3703]|uniref:Tc1-like transposase DDE domain-containing protein n=1 Tax=Coccidioides immitis RMSCC 3703 TaxID=454286 RepID=A0A0J8QPM8_COCIT|nr:hypothetical protein CISG_09667 [Coccidioides immitis RMSCC 3703]